MIENKNIGIIGEYPQTPGGIATHVKGLVNVLSEKNKIFLIAPNLKSSYEIKENIEIYRTKRINRKYFTTLTTILPTTIKAFSLRNKVDLFHCHGFPFGVSALINKKPLVLTVHGYSSLETLARGRVSKNSLGFKLLRKMEKLAVKRADAIICVDSRIEKWLKEELTAKKVFCIPNGVNIEEFSHFINGKKVRKMYGIEDKDKLIITSSLFTPMRDLEGLLYSLPLILKSNENVKLLLIGEGILEEKLKRIVSQLKISDNVVFCGFVSHNDMPKYYSSAEIIFNSFIHPNREEYKINSLLRAMEEKNPIGTSFSTIEALASGKPLVFSVLGGIKDKISNDEVGIIIPARQPTILAETIIELLNNEQLQKKLGNNARKYVEEKRNWKKIVEQISEVYKYTLRLK